MTFLGVGDRTACLPPSYMILAFGPGAVGVSAFTAQAVCLAMGSLT